MYVCNLGMEDDGESKTDKWENEISDDEMRIFVNLHAGTAQIMSVAQSIDDEFHTSLKTLMKGYGEVCLFFSFF